MSRPIILATCNLNQWAMDFEGNLRRTQESIRQAKAAGARYRLGPELELTGYGCEDHFLESDTFAHAWEQLAELLRGDDTMDIICDIGMPVMHKNVPYNCRVYVLNKRILMIRPKMNLADSGNYREGRWFSPWQRGYVLEEYFLPRSIRELTTQQTVPFGVGAISTWDTVLGCEACEELWTPKAPHIAMALDGVEIIANGSGSHHQLRKLQQRMDLIFSATKKAGGVYLYSNHKGCDGSRLYFDGSAMIVVNGEVFAQGTQFSLEDVEVVTAIVDLDEVRVFRGSAASRSLQASATATIPRVKVDFELSPAAGRIFLTPGPPKEPHILSPMQEIAYGPSSWLWDYLRRSGMRGYFLPLSGGADSAAVAALVAIMCQSVCKSIAGGNAQALRDVRRITRDESFAPADWRELCGRLFHTCYMGSKHSSTATLARAQNLAAEIGAQFHSLKIDAITSALVDTFATVTERTPVPEGSPAEDLALQNIQARSRMVMSYFLAQLLPWSRGGQGGLLVLGTANVDECLRGYMTKYDCSSADINPIGGICKVDLRNFLAWCAAEMGWASLATITTAVPSAELRAVEQSDEVDMGMTYEELSCFGRLRKVQCCGPLSMYQKLLRHWGPRTEKNQSAAVVADKVKLFFKYYGINRHKATTITPAYHAESYSPDDNRFDLRQFLYPAWEWQFRRISEEVDRLERAQQQLAATTTAAPAPAGEASL